MSTKWETLKDRLRKAGSVAAEKAGLMAQIGKVKLAIVTIERSIGKTEKELGRHVYGLVTKGETKIAGDEKVKRFADKITSLEADLKEKRAELEELRKEKKVAPCEETATEEESGACPEEKQEAD